MPSQSKMSRDAAPGPAGRSSAGTRAAAGRSAEGPVSDLLDPAADPRLADARPGRRDRGARSRMLRNWRVRSRLVLLIAIPTATAVALGASSIVSSWRTAVSYQRIVQLASLSSKVTQLADKLEYERDNTVLLIALKTDHRTGTLETNLNPAASQQLQVVDKLYKYTDRYIGPVRAGVSAIGSGFPSGVSQDARSVLAVLAAIKNARRAAQSPQTSAMAVIDHYSKVINVLLAFENQIALSSNNPQLTSTVSAVSQISRLANEYATQRALIVYALTVHTFAPNMLDMLKASVANKWSDLGQFQNFASNQQNELYTVALDTGSLKDRVDFAESTVIQRANLGGSLAQTGINPQEWFGNVTTTIGKIHDVEHTLVAQAINRAQALRKKAILSAVAIGSAVLLVLIISLLFTVIVGRSMVRPLRRLRAGALEVAGVRLPETVRRMSESDSENIAVDVDPINVNSFDEIGEVARAFDQVHREALRLAANEAALRGNINAMFVNLSRRSQSLVERQIRLIDELEQGEQDSERLGSLFQMDHLATRMRRNSENLLVLAGHDSSRRWNQPVALVDVLRAAISEIEQYERVTLNVQPGLAVRGPAVNDVVHLIAELAENATSYSSADTPVSVSGHLLSSGGVLLDITDLGVGMGSEEMAHANWRLDNPPVVDVAVSRRMGLFVVARLAARHGIRVRLRPASGAGLTALVWLPDEVVVREAAATPSGLGTFPEPLARFAIGAAPAGPSGSGDVGAAPIGSGGVGAASSGDWPATGYSTAEQEVAAARMPRFEPPQQDESGGELGPQRIPGLGPHPGMFGPATTGPIPTVKAESTSEPTAFGVAESGAADSFGTVPTPAFGADHPSAPSRPFVDEWSAPSDAPGTVDQPAQAGAAVSEPAVASPADQSSQPGLWPADQAHEPGRSVAAPAGEQPEPAVLGAPITGLRGAGSSFLSQDPGRGSANGDVIVPPAASLGEENRLPIFEAVESDWFRRGRPAVDAAGQAERLARASWTSPADEGWKAAEAAVVPSSGGTTLAGLPRRVPKANLIPGTAAVEPAAATPVRSAAATRERFASLQRGMREGRAASSADKDDETSDETSDE